MSHMYRTATLSLLATTFALTCVAQTSTQQEKINQEERVNAELRSIKAESGGSTQEEKSKAEMLEMLELRSRVVTGKPYAAESQTDVVQTLADGNRIVRHTSSKFFRDNSGRTRREQTFSAINPSIPGETKVFIDDPVANVAWVLDPGSHEARKLIRSLDYLVSRTEQLAAEKQPTGPLKLPQLNEGRDIVTEQLGQKTIEGLLCKGERNTITIPAGQIGNERPVVIVTETWNSPAIGGVVASTTTDPRFGQTTYQLSHVQLGEQQQDLFAPPAGYQVEGSR